MDNPCRYCVHKPCQIKGVLCQQKKYYNKMRMFFDTERARLIRKKYSQKQEELFGEKDDQSDYIKKTVSWYGGLTEQQRNELDRHKS